MKAEAYLFTVVAGFFLVTGAVYAGWSREPAGTAALIVSFLMASLIAFFFARTYQRLGSRPEDSKTSEVAERAGPLDFFPPQSPYPVLTAIGAGLAALGVVHGLWLLLIGVGVLLAGVLGLVFEYVRRFD
ncbi:cytochrome c oxidase polypeptide 4 [Streptomyces sulfonofaciens]|uniref:cytochrome-c oxidase n=1 Tax=Streptomyces sulfonofaciens TaxID=68272 RepID=A0A919GHI9_9ACTN|nr:cytochrome c oxidase subunit 4 [Streptomyces sulfonofaciens]GHH84090.1 cytochrome c oxidase polypeptide 4 [Streptomyces sulfonofaciens]